MTYFNLNMDDNAARAKFLQLSNELHPDKPDGDGRKFGEMKEEYRDFTGIKKHWQEIASVMLPAFEQYQRQKSGKGPSPMEMLSKVDDGIDVVTELTGKGFNFLTDLFKQAEILKKQAKKTFNVPKKRTKSTRTVK